MELEEKELEAFNEDNKEISSNLLDKFEPGKEKEADMNSRESTRRIESIDDIESIDESIGDIFSQKVGDQQEETKIIIGERIEEPASKFIERN